MSKPLAIVPGYVTTGHDVEILRVAVQSLRDTVGDACDLLVVDDGSPETDLVTACRHIVEGLDGEFIAKGRNEGFAKTVNVGLRRCLNNELDAVLVNADIEFKTETWLDLMLQRKDPEGRLASIVGARLLYPNGLIQHAGVYFSLLYREFSHIYQYGPGNLPEALNARVCPVTAALQFIRHECLEHVGIYDERFLLGWEDVDYCVRTWKSGRSVIYEPGIVATHHESFFRGRVNPKIQDWQAKSWLYFCEKHATTSFAEFVPSLVLEEAA